ncbi:MAG: HPF/RaiA family ribosome-associated protein [Planctomycetaceae bacterium]
MQWHLKAQGVDVPDGLASHIAARLAFALGRFMTRVERVVVFLHDVNGPRGGIDKACRILVRVRGCGMLTAAVVDSEWTVAVDRATTAISHTVARSIERRKQPWHLRVRRSPLDPSWIRA